MMPNSIVPKVQIGLLWLVCLLFMQCEKKSENFVQQEDMTEWPTALQQQIEDKKPAKKIDILLTQIEDLQYKNVKLAISYAEFALELALTINEPIKEAESRFWLATLKLEEQVYSSQLAHLMVQAEIARSIFEEANQKDWLIRCWELMASIAHFQNSVDRKTENSKNNLAEEIIQNGFHLYQQQAPSEKNEVLLANLLTTKAAIKYKENRESAMTWWDQAENISERVGDEVGIARINLNKGLFSEDNNNSAYFERAIQIHHKLGHVHALKRALLRYGTFCINRYYRTRDTIWWNMGLDHLHQGLVLEEEHLCEALMRLGHAHETYYRVNKDKIDLSNRVDSASYYFRAAIQRNKVEKNTYCLNLFMDQRKSTCVRNENCHILLGDMMDVYSIILEDRDSNISKAKTLQSDYQAKIAASREQRRRENILTVAIGAFLALAIVFLYIFQRQKINNLNSESQAQRAQIKALSARMNPHFISNTLNAIDSMIYTNNKADASKYLVEFAKLSRLVLANSESTLIPLNKEIETLQYYLSLEKMRFEEEVNFELIIDPNLDLGAIHLPPMLIQPFVENALLHGIQPKEGQGRIMIRFQNKGSDHMECIIEDNGIGRKQSKLLQAQSSVNRKSYSMNIAEDRIELINKISGANFEIEDLHDSNQQVAGTSVKITLPKNLNQDG